MICNKETALLKQKGTVLGVGVLGRRTEEEGCLIGGRAKGVLEQKGVRHTLQLVAGVRLMMQLGRGGAGVSTLIEELRVLWMGVGCGLGMRQLRGRGDLWSLVVIPKLRLLSMSSRWLVLEVRRLVRVCWRERRVVLCDSSSSSGLSSSDNVREIRITTSRGVHSICRGISSINSSSRSRSRRGTVASANSSTTNNSSGIGSNTSTNTSTNNISSDTKIATTKNLCNTSNNTKSCKMQELLQRYVLAD